MQDSVYKRLPTMCQSNRPEYTEKDTAREEMQEEKENAAFVLYLI